MMNEWTDEELQLATSSYLDMLSLELSKQPYVKSHFRRQLATQIARSEKSIEYRYQNISSVLATIDLPYINGYKPMKNVGMNVRDRLIRILKDLGHIAPNTTTDIDETPTSKYDVLENTVRKLRIRGFKEPPQGQQRPLSIETTTKRIPRDPAVKAWILENAKGDCEMCQLPGPFVTPDGDNYLEVHHVKRLGDQGTDTVTNAVALCPNCHREAHYGTDPQEFIRLLCSRVSRIKLEEMSHG